MKLTYLGHSGFSLELEGAQVLIDPFITGNPLAVHQPESFSPSHIILTHAHGDHVGDTETIARRSNAEIISSFEIINYFAAKDLNGHGMNHGGGFDFPFGRVTFTPAWHSSSFPDGTYGGMPMGVVIQAAGKQLYHAGDTALFSDMALIGRKGLDAALLPIGDNFTMGPEDALEAIKLLKPKVVIPIHYNTFELIEQDTDAFKAAVERQTEAKCVILKAGEDYELS
jgi:L-ascorbate metabolism protein UlaG (beta-lactamase superfamily)